MKWNLDDLPVFVAVIGQNGISAAARELDMPKSTVSTALTRLEQALGLRLIDRSSRSLRVTAEGEAFHRRALLILEQAREADDLMAGLGSVPTGRVSVALPPAFSLDVVAPRLPEFRARHPGLELDIIVTSQGAALVRDRVDLAVVVGILEDSELISRTLIEGRLIWVASPAWLSTHLLGETLDAVSLQIQICEARYAQRRTPVQVHGEAAYMDLARGITQVNDPLVVLRTVMAGGGVSMLPHQYCVGPLREGRLVEVLPHIRLSRSSARLTAVYPGRRLLSPRVRVLLDFLLEVCQELDMPPRSNHVAGA
ncbi:LysR family transcriptional regulator [Castellaniella sp.]|uniref:LysR family transcriptional regulator n=1 Tax=Castellaniella sp. TaxID=1955812 RepID=UPI002AFEA8A3|nr:LysR family transcriptional regulator [Castellaniella sp.]